MGYRRTERGQALIEFAFIAPIMFVFLFSIVDFGIAIDRRMVLQHAVREGARYAAVHTTSSPTNCDEIVQRTLDQAQGVDNVTVDVTYPDPTANAGDRVKVSGDFTWDFPILSEMFTAFGVTPPSIEMTPSGTARLEHSVDPATGCAGSS